MAITLDELLGKNKIEEGSSVDYFPTEDEFYARRLDNYRMSSKATLYPSVDERPKFDIQNRPVQQPPRSVEEVRRYEEARPYVAPRRDEYRPASQPRDYGRYDVPSVDTYGGYDAPARDYRNDYYDAPAQSMRATDRGFYDFAAAEQDRASERDLYSRLSMTSGASDVDQKTAQDSATQYRNETATSTGKKVKLGLKAKIIIVAYAVVFSLVAILIGVNAESLNSGTAKVPSSAALSQDQAIVKTVDTTTSMYDFVVE